MTRIRGIGAMTLAATLLVVSLMTLGVSSPAEAETGIDDPGTVTAGRTVTVSAEIDYAARVDLQVAPPGGSYGTIASGGNLFGTTRLSNTVSIPHNGVYKVRLKGAITGTVYDDRSFKVLVPPAAPSGLRAGPSGGGLLARWNRGADNDLVGYEVAVTGVRSRTGSITGLCPGASCAMTTSLPGGVSGDVTVDVRALRSDGSGGVVRSRASSVRANVGGGARSRAPARHIGTGLPGGRSADPLNPLGGNASITLPTVGADGTSAGFQYPMPAPEVADPGGPAGSAAKNVSAAGDLPRARNLALALILLMVAAHLGTRTRRIRMAQVGDAARAAGPAKTTPNAESGPDLRPPAIKGAGTSGRRGGGVFRGVYRGRRRAR